MSSTVLEVTAGQAGPPDGGGGGGPPGLSTSNTYVDGQLKHKFNSRSPTFSETILSVQDKTMPQGRLL